MQIPKHSSLGCSVSGRHPNSWHKILSRTEILKQATLASPAIMPTHRETSAQKAPMIFYVTHTTVILAVHRLPTTRAARGSCLRPTEHPTQISSCGDNPWPSLPARSTSSQVGVH